MKCSNCGNEQSEGRFCEKCGGEISGEQVNTEEESVHNTQEQAQAASSGNDFVEQVQVASKNYWAYYLKYLKQPSEITKTGRDERNNGIISIVLTILLFSLTYYSLIKPALDYMRSFHDVSFLSVVGNLSLGFAILTLIIIALLFFVNKLISERDIDFQTILSIYGGYLTPIIAANAAALLLALINTTVLSIIILSLTIILLSLIIPLHMISRFFTEAKTKLDPYYGYLIYFGATILTFYILSRLLIDSMILEILDLL